MRIKAFFFLLLESLKMIPLQSGMEALLTQAMVGDLQLVPDTIWPKRLHRAVGCAGTSDQTSWVIESNDSTSPPHYVFKAMEWLVLLIAPHTADVLLTLRHKCYRVETNICILDADSSEPSSISTSPLSELWTFLQPLSVFLPSSPSTSPNNTASRCLRRSLNMSHVHQCLFSLISLLKTRLLCQASGARFQLTHQGWDNMLFSRFHPYVFFWFPIRFIFFWIKFFWF